MSAFFWTAGHLGWGFFALLVFSAVWLLFTDFVWRLKTVAIRRLLAMMACGWLVGALLILFAARCLLV